MRRRVPRRPQDDARPIAECLQGLTGVPQEAVPKVLQVELGLPQGRKAQQRVSPLPELAAWRLVPSGQPALLQELEEPVQLVLQWG